MLTGIHFLLTYACTFECDHCFLHCGPNAKGTFTLNQLRSVFDEMTRIETLEWVYFEGGEPFLFYPLMFEGIGIAHDMGLKIGLVSNAYWATSLEDATLWLKPMCELRIVSLSLSDDRFHRGEENESPARLALAAARELGIPADTICIDEPTVQVRQGNGKARGEPVIGGGVLFKGRAAEKLVEGLPTKPWRGFKECPHEDLENPKRVHVDSYGNVHLCQGVSMGNMWETPLSTLITDYDPHSHPICGPLIKGGPALLAREYNIDHDDRYVDECHFCYVVRRALIDRFPQYLAPRQVYGLE